MEEHAPRPRRAPRARSSVGVEIASRACPCPYSLPYAPVALLASDEARSPRLLAGRGGPDTSRCPRPQGDARLRRARGRRRLHRALDRLAGLAELEPEARVVVLEAGRCGHGPERAQRRLRQRDVVRTWADARPLRRPMRAIALGRASTEAVDEIGRFCVRAGGGRLVSSGRLPAGLGAPAQDGVWDEAVRALPRARRARGRHRAERRGGGEALPLAALPRRRLLPRGRDRPARRGSCSACATGSRAAPTSGSLSARRFARCAPGRGAASPRRPRPRVRARVLRAGDGVSDRRHGLALCAAG